MITPATEQGLDCGRDKVEAGCRLVGCYSGSRKEDCIGLVLEAPEREGEFRSFREEKARTR